MFNGVPFHFPAHLCGLSPSRLLPVRRVFLSGHQTIPPELRYSCSITQILLCVVVSKIFSKMSNKYELLNQKLVDASVERNLPELLEGWFVDYILSDVKKDQQGWYLVTTYPRYFGDMGIYLGKNYKIATKELDYWLIHIE